MGVKGQSQVLYLSDELQFAHFVAILQAQNQSHAKLVTPECNNEMALNETSRQPCVMIDSNQVGCK